MRGNVVGQTVQQQSQEQGQCICEENTSVREEGRIVKQTHLTALEMMLSTMDCKLMMSPVTKKDE
jgi:hypothetical protein